MVSYYFATRFYEENRLDDGMKSFVEHLFENLPIPLYGIAITLHCLGIYLLICLKHKRRNQDTVILNLSIAEIAMSLFDLTQNILSRGNSVTSTNIRYLTIAQCSFFVLPSFLIMILLTLDRFFEVYLNLQYFIYFNKKKTRILLALCWLTGLVCGIVLLSLKKFYEDTSTIIYKYIFPVTEGVFFVVAVVTYTYLYKKFRLVRRHPSTESVNRSTKATAPKSGLRGRNFFAPLLIIATFLIFVMVPDVTNLILFYILETGTNLHSNILLLFYAIGFTCDALIYIFLQKHIRDILMLKLNLKKRKTGDVFSRAAVVRRHDKSRPIELGNQTSTDVHSYTNTAHEQET
ncbi:uncharacterized protein LOC130640955 isoform X1 [Hydractinia symbiolongicarpus]|uniref:uncharacterized protein LOC130640955 isoform X1 n=2 Tax=Hydractinia symbiolongicarpus TaxID=13093 RepID=UPI00254CCD93|nr:uncharacterized protein LOC130640955 isoform X1 [Hydractinia symbiolongicarpus]